MKKITAIILATALVLCMSIASFATTYTGNVPGIDVKAQYINGVIEGGISYSYEVTWGAMEFTYTHSGNKVWNAGEHDYDLENSKYTWSAQDNYITVTNHSNTAIEVGFAFTPAGEYSELTGTFTNSTLSLPNAEYKDLDDASLTGKTELSLSGPLSDSVVSKTVVGTITITVS